MSEAGAEGIVSELRGEIASLHDALIGAEWHGDEAARQRDVWKHRAETAEAALEAQSRALAEAMKTEDWLRNEISRIRSIHLKPEAGVAPSLEAIQSAIRETGYKYFGDYALSDEQWDAVFTLINAAKHFAAERYQNAAADAAAELGSGRTLADANPKKSLSQDQEIAGLREEVRRKDERIKVLEDRHADWKPVCSPPHPMLIERGALLEFYRARGDGTFWTGTWEERRKADIWCHINSPSLNDRAHSALSPLDGEA